MSTDEDPLESTHKPLDADGRTAEEAIAEEIAQNGEVLNDWLIAKDRHAGVASVQGTHTPTPKAEPKEKLRPDTTEAGRFRGKVAPQERVEPKAGARIYPRTKFRPNDASKTGASRG